MAQIAKNSKVGGIPILDFIYPVGAIFMTMDDDFNPGQYWGGEWLEITDKFIKGVFNEESSTVMNTAGVVGGESTHTLTVDELPSHNHPGSYTPMTYGADWNPSANQWSAGSSGTVANYHQPTTVASQGGGQAHNNLPPFITAHIWRRTA